MILTADKVKVSAFILLVELPVRLERVGVLRRRAERSRDRLANRVDDGLKVFVILKHCPEARTLATCLLFKLVVDDWSKHRTYTMSYCP